MKQLETNFGYKTKNASAKIRLHPSRLYSYQFHNQAFAILFTSAVTSVACVQSNTAAESLDTSSLFRRTSRLISGTFRWWSLEIKIKNNNNITIWTVFWIFILILLVAGLGWELVYIVWLTQINSTNTTRVKIIRF